MADSQHKKPDSWLCTKEVAAYTKLSTSFFEKKRIAGATGGPPFFKISGCIRYKESDVDSWLNSCRQTPGGAS